MREGVDNASSIVMKIKVAKKKLFFFQIFEFFSCQYC
jgi:hypothetical protein